MTHKDQNDAPGLQERLRFALRDWDGKDRFHFPSINALDIAASDARIAELEAEVARLRGALENCFREANEPRKFWSMRIAQIAKAALGEQP